LSGFFILTGADKFYLNDPGRIKKYPKDGFPEIVKPL
jgi:hypothetical protein